MKPTARSLASVRPALLGAVLVSAACAPGALAQGPGEEGAAPVELGRVRWGRDLDAALAESRRSGKPVFALFQEIPGCATCQGFGQGPLSHPLLVEAIEELFVPLAVYNNRGGDDQRVLQRYGEPAWNNPVVRFLGADGNDVLPRRDRVWSTEGVAHRAVAALRAADRDVPAWLAASVAPERVETATFAMACFWQGEARLGGLEGVVGTRAGWLGGREVVEVRFDPERLERAELERAAEHLSCDRAGAPSARPERDAKDSDQAYFLRRSPLRHLPLSAVQRTKINSALGTGGDPAPWLSPRQRELRTRVEAALERDRGALAGLEAPERPTAESLAGYERELLARLGD